MSIHRNPSIAVITQKHGTRRGVSIEAGSADDNADDSATRYANSGIRAPLRGGAWQAGAAEPLRQKSFDNDKSIFCEYL